MKQKIEVTANAVQKPRAIALLTGLFLSLTAFSQADTTAAVVRPFSLPKSQLPTPGETSTSFFSAPVNESPYKIHYKIKTLTFPVDPRPEPPKSLVGALVNGIVETAIDDLLNNDCEDKNKFLVPIKPTTPVKY